CVSPNLFSKSVLMASKASCSSSPCASTVTSTPKPAASIITPIILLALTFCSSRAIKISLLYCAANCVNLAAARACNPNLLVITRFIEAINNYSLIRFLLDNSAALCCCCNTRNVGIQAVCCCVCHCFKQHRQTQTGD